MPSVLFVCTANRFRSPLAAAIFKRALEEVKDPEVERIARQGASWRVDSAGTWATPGQPALTAVREAAIKLGLDLESHSSKCVSWKLLAEYDLILVMQASQREALLSEFPQLEEHIYLFSHVVERGSYDIPDLFGSARGVEQVAVVMNDLIRRGLRYIAVLAFALSNQRSLA